VERTECDSVWEQIVGEKKGGEFDGVWEQSAGERRRQSLTVFEKSLLNGGED